MRRLKRWTPTGILAAVLIIANLAGIGLLTLRYQDQQLVVEGLYRQEGTVRAQIAAARRILRETGGDLDAAIATQHQRMAQASQALPITLDSMKVFRDLMAAASTTGVQISQVMMGSSADEGSLKRTPVSMQLSAPSVGEFVRFLSAVREKYPGAIPLIGSLTISGQIRQNLTISLYSRQGVAMP